METLGLKTLLQLKATVWILTLALLAEISVAITLATGSLSISHGWLSLTCIRFWSYGFSLLWRQIFSGCGGPVLALNWGAFLFDAIFYVAVGYVCVIAFGNSRRDWTKTIRTGLVATIYVTAMMALVLWARMTDAAAAL